VTSAVFDPLAERYDSDFTQSELGRLLRRRVWRWLDRAFARGDRVLELNCGTGEDAVHLAARGVNVLATDASEAMLEIARKKIASRELQGQVDVQQVELGQLDVLLGYAGKFDGAFSSFGGLNCVAEIAPVAQVLADLLKPGAHVVVCVMGPLVPWEWVWFLTQGEWRKAFRRLAARGTSWRGITVRYPTPTQLREAFGQGFILRHSAGLGVLVPPTFAAEWARRHPGWLERLDRWETGLERWPLMAWLGDHYLMEFVRA